MHDIGIITALPAEARSLVDRVLPFKMPEEVFPGIWLCISGMGADNALSCMQALSAQGIDAIVNLGVSGALDRRYKHGDILIPSFVGDEVSAIQIDPHWHTAVCSCLRQQGYVPHMGKLVSSTQIIAEPQQRHALARKTHSISVDMEAYPLAVRVKQIRGRLLVIKSIADNLDTIIPACVIRYIDQYSRPEMGRFILECLLHPQQIGQLLRLALCFRHAIKALCAINQCLRPRHFCLPE